MGLQKAAEEGVGRTGLLTVTAVFGIKQIVFNMDPVIWLLERLFWLIRVSKKNTIIELESGIGWTTVGEEERILEVDISKTNMV